MDAYREVTDLILSMLDGGTVPWHRPWRVMAGDGPMNLGSRRAYEGFSNVCILSMAPFDSPFWLTFNQARRLGGTVRRGERGTGIFFFKRLAVRDRADPGKTSLVPLLRKSTVFNLGQTEGIEAPPLPVPPPGFEPLAAAEAVVEGYAGRPDVVYARGGKCCYFPRIDRVLMVPRGDFDSPGTFYATLFHELTHSTMREGRAWRPDALGGSSRVRALEELTAELGSAFLCGHCGILGHKLAGNAAAYVDSWRRGLKDDKTLFMRAAARARKAVDHILGRAPAPDGDGLTPDGAPA
jgi:antirestriction protein ArdC